MSTIFGDKMTLYVNKKRYVKSLPIFFIGPTKFIKIYLFFFGKFYIQRIFKSVLIFIINIFKNMENNRKYF